MNIHETLLKRNILIVTVLTLGTFACSKRTTSQVAQSSTSEQSVYQDILSGLSNQEKIAVANALGLSLEELERRLKDRTLTFEQLMTAASVLKRYNGLSMSLNFKSDISTFVPSQEISDLPCLSYDPGTGIPGHDYLVDDLNPKITSGISVEIVPDENQVPRNYIFGINYEDKKCGAPKLKARCTLINNYALNRRTAWQLERRKEGLSEDFKDYPVKEYNLAYSWDCHFASTNSSNLSEQIFYNFFSAAEIGDVIDLSIEVYDGVGRLDSRSTRIPIYERLLSRVTIGGML